MQVKTAPKSHPTPSLPSPVFLRDAQIVRHPGAAMGRRSFQCRGWYVVFYPWYSETELLPQISRRNILRLTLSNKRQIRRCKMHVQARPPRARPPPWLLMRRHVRVMYSMRPFLSVLSSNGRVVPSPAFVCICQRC